MSVFPTVTDRAHNLCAVCQYFPFQCDRQLKVCQDRGIAIQILTRGIHSGLDLRLVAKGYYW